MPTDDGDASLSIEAFERVLADKRRKAGTDNAARQPNKAGTPRAIDGRISSHVKNGFVQLNVRVPLDLKNQVLEVRATRKAVGDANCDVGDIVAAALRQFLQHQRVS